MCLAALVLVSGCVVTSPETLKKKHFDLNTLVQKSMDEELLLNVVRLKYRDTSMFLKVNAINATYSIEIGATADAGAQNRNPGHVLALGTGATYVEKPTISYAPLQGDEFTERLLSPVGLDALLLLARSGWSVERLLKLAVQSANGIKNAPSASGPTPSYAPEFERFSDAVKAMRSLQTHRLLQLGVAQDSGQAILQILPSKTEEETVRTLKDLLQLDADRDVFSIQSGLGYADAETIRLEARSMMGILFYLSQAVEVPQAHRRAGWVTQTLGEDGAAFDWTRLMDPLFHVQWSEDPPAYASVAVPYRGVWFYIADDDLESKSTFTLLSQLFALQAGTIRNASPLLTLPIL